MINLLPADLIVKNRRDYAKRRAVVIAMLLSTLFLSGVIVNGSILIMLIFRARGVSAELAGTNRYDTEQHRQLRQTVKQTNGRTSRFRELLAGGTSAGSVWDRVNELSPIGINLKEFDFLKAETGEISLEISGSAHTRQNLLDFVAALRGNQLFADVESPVSNLIKDRDAEFTINLHIKK